jgi:hypothetical protein
MMGSVIAARSESAAACARPLDPGTMPGISYRFCRIADACGLHAYALLGMTANDRDDRGPIDVVISTHA